MQGQRTGFESLQDTIELNSPSPRNPTMEQEVFWNNTLIGPIETQRYVLPSSNSAMPYVNTASQESLSLNLWNSSGTSGSVQLHNPISHDETKMGHAWTSSLTMNVGEHMTEERQREAASMLSLGNINLNNNNDAPESSNQNACWSDQTGLCLPCAPALYRTEHIPSSSNSSNMFEHSSGHGRFSSEEGSGRTESSFSARRSSCKRKNIEGFSGQPSTSGSASLFHRGETSSLHVTASYPDSFLSPVYQSGLFPPDEQHNQIFGNASREIGSDHRLSVNAAGNAESSRRNFRMRVTHAQQQETPPPNFCMPGSSSGHSVWPSTRLYSPFIPINQPVEPRTLVTGPSSYNQPNLPVVPGFTDNVQFSPWNAGFRSGAGSSSSTSVAAGEHTSLSRSILMNNTAEDPIYAPACDVRPSINRRALNFSGESSNAGGNSDPLMQASSTNRAGLHPPLATTWIPQHSTVSRHHWRGSEGARRSSFTSSSFELGSQSSSLNLQHSGHSSLIDQIGHQHSAVLHDQQQALLRSSAVADRQNDGIQGIPLTFRTLSGRRRILSEHIRNALSIMRRGDSLRFEDVFLFDCAVFFGAADLHDRHRDMRLDVDNMSYEELLALEERIGNVSTGLSEETIMNHLDQHQYSSPMGEASQEIEPCCICQEDYAEGEELGKLDCGHEFHTPCIKQWLMHKNVCPICKETALNT